MAKEGAPKLWTIDLIEQIADELIKWAHKDDSIVMAEFYGSQLISYQRAFEFEEQSQKFAEAKRIAKTLVGARREKGALKGELDSGLVKKSMALYDPEMKQYELDQKSAASAGVKDVIEQGVINAVRDINAQRDKGIDGSSKPSMENK
jgi:hypothetical protein